MNAEDQIVIEKEAAQLVYVNELAQEI